MMKPKLVCRFRVLLAEKEMLEGRSISLREVVRESGVPISTVVGLANNTLKEIPAERLVGICCYLGCEPGDLLKLEDKVPPPPPRTTP